MILPYMRKGFRTEYITESYVASPPALFILDEQGNTFTLGFQYQLTMDSPHGHYGFNVLKNGQETGEFASHIERRNGKVRIFTRSGYKNWNGHSFN